MQTVRKNSVQNEVYKILREGIISLRLEPGTVMSTQEMADNLNVSRTPVREAFIRLHEEGLVKIVPQKETIVSRIDMERVLQERFIRESLELAVIDPFLDNCSPGALEEIKRTVMEQKKCRDEFRCADFISMDDQMHRIFFVEADKKLAWDTLKGVSGHDFRYRVLAVQKREIIDSVIAQHERIIALIEEGKKEEVRSELIHHLQKIRIEKKELQDLYPDYFLNEENKAGFRVGRL